jgi:hypothetical protein
MHPPFFVVDHRIDYDILPVEERKVIRRNRPAPLALNMPAPGTPVVIVGAVGPPPPLTPGPLSRLAALLRAALQRRRGVIREN